MFLLWLLLPFSFLLVGINFWTPHKVWYGAKTLKEYSVSEGCSHARSNLYFVESIGKKAVAIEAEYKEENHDVIVTQKPDGKAILFGYLTDTSTRGVYKLETNSEKPFLRWYHTDKPIVLV